jgi:hypothetical protein
MLPLKQPAMTLQAYQHQSRRQPTMYTTAPEDPVHKHTRLLANRCQHSHHPWDAHGLLPIHHACVSSTLWAPHGILHHITLLLLTHERSSSAWSSLCSRLQLSMSQMHT